MVELAEGALLDGQTAAQGFRLARNSIGRSSRLRYVQEFSVAVGRLKKKGLVVTELSTLGGDPEVARMIGEDIRFHTEKFHQRSVRLSGKGGDPFRWNDLHEFLCD
jgi:hypothetical protein